MSHQFRIVALIKTHDSIYIWSIFQSDFRLIHDPWSEITALYKSPYQCLYNSTPSYNHLRVFGCYCYPWIPQCRQAPTNLHYLSFLDIHPTTKHINVMTLQLTKFSSHAMFIFRKKFSLFNLQISSHLPNCHNLLSIMLLWYLHLFYKPPPSPDIQHNSSIPTSLSNNSTPTTTPHILPS